MDGGRLKTLSFRRQGGSDVSIGAESEEFAIILWEGGEETFSKPRHPALSHDGGGKKRTLRASDYRVEAIELKDSPGEQGIVVRLEPTDKSDPSVRVEYRGRRGDHYLRKRLVIDGSRVIDAVEVESLDWSARGERGGLGQPAFIDGIWFAGLEHPAGENRQSRGRLSCRHHPGKAQVVSPWAVVGVIAEPNRALEDEFERYLDALRPRATPSLQYNTWYDRRGQDLDPGALLGVFDHFHRHLLGPYGLSFDAFVIDDGWQERRSLWQPNERWRRGFRELASRVGDRGSELGLWLPLNGYGLDLRHGAAKGWHRCDHHKGAYCLADPAYQEELKKVLIERLSDGNIAFLKHDFNFLSCSSAHHAHLPTLRHGREANVDAQLAVLAFEREVRPGLRLSVTSNVWPSPWWLPYADFLWMGDGDYEHERRHPHTTDRDAEMTRRDQRLFQLLRVEKAAVPMANVMTHGLIRGDYAPPASHETLETWSRYVMMFLGRGALLHELYITAETMPADHWAVLGPALRWARAESETLSHTRMIGGDPSARVPYGYIHWSDNKGIACLRNPSLAPARMTLTLNERPRHLSQRTSWESVMVFPHREKLSPLTTEHPLDVELGSERVVVIEFLSRPPAWLANLPPGRFEIDQSAGSARLVTYRRPAPVEWQWEDEPTESHKRWDRQLTVFHDGPIQEARLSIVREPAAALHVDLPRQGTSSEASLVADTHKRWDVMTLDLPLERDMEAGGIDDKAGDDLAGRAWTRRRVSASLPAGPPWPTEGTMTITLTCRGPLQVATSERMEISDPPIWPPAARDATWTQEFELARDVRLERGRRTIETFGWIGLVIVAPVVALTALACSFAWRGRGIAARRRWLSPAVFVALTLALAAAISWSPVREFARRALDY